MHSTRFPAKILSTEVRGAKVEVTLANGQLWYFRKHPYYGFRKRLAGTQPKRKK